MAPSRTPDCHDQWFSRVFVVQRRPLLLPGFSARPPPSVSCKIIRTCADLHLRRSARRAGVSASVRDSPSLTGRPGTQRARRWLGPSPLPPHRTDCCRPIRRRVGVKADLRVRQPGTFTCTRYPAVTSALDAVPEAYHNPEGSLAGGLCTFPVMRSPGPSSGLAWASPRLLHLSSSVPSWTRWSPLNRGGLSVAG